MHRIRVYFLVGVLLVACGASQKPSSTPFPVTYVNTDTPLAVLATATPAPPVVTSSPGPTPSATALDDDYTVVAGDTLWDIAASNGVSLDEIAVANPGIDPDLLHPGDVIHIPHGGATPAPRVVAQVSATSAPNAGPKLNSAASARVAADADQLRLRKGPSTDDDVVQRLAALTPLQILQHSPDGAWLEVALADGTRGWVKAEYVDTGNSAVLSVASLPRPEPYLSNFTSRAKAIFRMGLELGNRPNVFAVIGDSNSASPAYLEPFDRDHYNLGSYGYLQDTINYFKGSFTFTSVAAVVGFDTLKMMDPARANSGACKAGESPLTCEYRRKRPSVALILLGTNDTMNWQNFEANYRPIVEETIALGIVPVLFTKGDDLESTKYHAPNGYINGVIKRLSQEYGVPLLDLHAVSVQLPHGGFGSDGFHFNLSPDGQTANFTGEHMNYGYTIRNLTALQMLDAVRRLILNN